MAQRQRRQASMGQMLIAVCVLMVPVVVIYWLFTREPVVEPRSVDWQPVVARAQEQSPYPVATPRNLPEGWTVVRARWTKVGEAGLNQQPAVGNTLELGFITPTQMYIGLDQRDIDGRGLITKATRDGRPDGTSSLAGVTWQRYVTSDDRTRSLVRADGKSTLVISGDLPYEALEAFATTLT